MVTPASVQRKIRLLGMSEYRRHPASPNQTGPSTQSKPSAMRLTGALPKTYRLNAGSITSKNDLSLVPRYSILCFLIGLLRVTRAASLWLARPYVEVPRVSALPTD